MTIHEPRRRLVRKTAAPPGYRPFKPIKRTIKEMTPEYMVIQEALDAKELQELEEVLKRKRPRAAKMKNEGAGDSDDERKARYNDRDSSVSWFNAEVECPSVQRQLQLLVKEANQRWPIIQVEKSGELACTYEDVQYSVYGPGQHFHAWHQDAFEKGHDPEDARQITVVLMLSRRSDYTGGNFQAKVKVKDRKVTRCVPLDLGDALVFPSKKLMHRVSVVKSGLRKTLVFWAWEKSSCKFYAEKAKSK